LARLLVGCDQVFIDRLPRLLGEFEPYGPTSFPLAHGSPLHCMAIRSNVIDPDGNEVATPKLAVDGEIEQRQLSHLSLKLEPGSYGPDMLLPQGRSGSNQPVFVPGVPLRAGRSWNFVLLHGRIPPLLTVNDHARLACMSVFAVAIGVAFTVAFGCKADMSEGAENVAFDP
jgi:hypothetical protein